MNRMLLSLGLAALTSCPFAAAACEWDARKAQEAAVVSNGTKWIDGRCLPIEGRAFDDTERYYDRLPRSVTTNVNRGVRGMKKHTSGLQFRFRTDSRTLKFTWANHGGGVPNMPPTSVSGIDVYRFDESCRRWVYVKTGVPEPRRTTLSIGWTPGTACLVNLPLWNDVEEFALGVDPAARIEALGPRASGVEKPVVFYGTSITHGGCASRPGLSFVNIVGRELDVPVVNLGFSGSGLMEFEMSEHLAKIDASCYVLDCLWNMSYGEKDGPGRSVEVNYERFIRNLRAKRPDVPIVMAEQCDVFGKGPCDKDLFVRRLHAKLVAEGWTGLIHLRKEGMFTGEGEGTVDGVHPNDLGMWSLSKAYGKAVKDALGLK